MPTNVTVEYTKAEREYQQASTSVEKLRTLEIMLREVPKHKGTETLRMEIKTKISKLKEKLKKEREQKKKGFSLAVKKEGAAQVVLIGTPNSGKSTLLNQLTGTKVGVADYPFTTTKPEIGMMDVDGIKVQIIEIPAITENLEETEQGPTFLGIIRTADLMVWLYNDAKEKKLLKKELADIKILKVDYQRNNPKNNNPKKLIWQSLNIIKVYTKEPGKKPSFPPIPLKKGAIIKDMASKIHKDFIKKFNYARIWGSSAKFPGQTCGINHKLKDNDIVELHLK